MLTIFVLEEFRVSADLAVDLFLIECGVRLGEESVKFWQTHADGGLFSKILTCERMIFLSRQYPFSILSSTSRILPASCSTISLSDFTISRLEESKERRYSESPLRSVPSSEL